MKHDLLALVVTILIIFGVPFLAGTFLLYLLGLL